MKVQIRKMSKEDAEKEGIFDWPTWSCDVSEFDWEYPEEEKCYFIQGKVTVVAEDGQEYHIESGDFVVFPKGLKCRWIVKEPVLKHYNF